MPESSSTTVPSITSRVRIRSSRMPFWVMSCQIVSESETGTTPSHRQRDPGLLGERGGKREHAGQQGGHEVEEADPEEPDEPVRAAVDPPVEGPDLVLGQDRQVHLHEVADRDGRTCPC